MLPTPSDEFIERYGKAGPRYTSYPPATEWTPNVRADEARVALTLADAVDAPLSLYVHIPFCVEMCRFCGCNVIATKDRSRADEYLDTLEKEVSLWTFPLLRRRNVSQLHLGGGTPTFLSIEQLTRLDGILRRFFTFLPNAEMSIEVDPDITTVEQIAHLGKLGFNRLSAGIQDLEPEVQQAIGRIQSAEKTESIIRAARTAGFKSVNVDLMYGLPFQTPDSMRHTLARVLHMGPDRAAIFGYAHVPWMKPQQRLLPQAHLPNPRQRVELFITAADVFEQAGFQQVGLDHFARETDEIVHAQRIGGLTRNFQGYSAAMAPDTIAFGVSAISDVAGVFLQSAHKLSDWKAAIDEGHLPIERGLRRTPMDELRGAIIRDVMCLLRLDVAPLRKEFGPRVDEVLKEAAPKLETLAANGLIAPRLGGFDVTPLGRIFLRPIAMVFDAYLERLAGDRPVFSKAV